MQTLLTLPSPESQRAKSYYSLEENNVRRVVRMTSLQAAGVTSLFLLLYLYLNLTNLAALMVVGTLTYMACFWGLRTENKLWPRVTLCLSSNLFIFVPANVLGFDCLSWVYFFPALCCGVLFFTRFESKIRLGISLLPIFLLATTIMFRKTGLPLPGFGPLSDFPYAELVSAVSILSSMIILLSAVFTFHKHQVKSGLRIESQSALLIEQEKMSSLGTLASGISHEINNALSSLRLNLDFVQRELNKPEASLKNVKIPLERLGKITHRMNSIVSSLRIYSHGDSNEKTKLDLSKVFEESLVLLQAKLHNRQIEISFENEDDCSVVEFNQSNLIQVFVNLISNSIDAISDNPERWIKIKARKNGDNIELLFTDSGHGIPDEIAKKIFDPFFSTKGVGKGTGLGMSLVQGLVNSNGGNIYYDKSAEHTQFVVSLKPFSDAA